MKFELSMLSVIIPALNEAGRIEAVLGDLQPLREQGHELIVVDGGSADDTRERARPLCDRLLSTERGRARQQNAGAAVAAGEALWFVHADSRLGPEVWPQLRTALAQGAEWGFFEVRLSGHQRLLRMVEWSMNRRSRLTGVATGDQALFVRRELFRRAGGFADIPLMEDVALSRMLRALTRPHCLPGPLTTSSRRWEERGICRTVALMWRLRLAYALGADPHRLHRRYYGGP